MEKKGKELVGRAEYNKARIVRESVGVLAEYAGQITLRQLYYRLVAAGMTNDVQHYKRVVSAMTDARWGGDVRFEAFIDRERAMCGETMARATVLEDEVERAKEQVRAWMEGYRLNQWENQREYVEVWIEKKALQGVFEGPCKRHHVGLAPCKGYPSLTFLHDGKERFSAAEERGQDLCILYFGDYDPSGEDIPRVVKRSLERMGITVEVERVALTQEQIDEMGLPSVPAKESDSRSRTWGGAGVVELDAVEPAELSRMVESAIMERFDVGLGKKLEARERRESKTYRVELQNFVRGL